MFRFRSTSSILFNTLRRIRRSGGVARRESVLSLADQCVVSAVPFLITVLLGRWCGAEELGAYALGFTIVVFLFNAQMALISIPYTNQWRRRAKSDQDGFAGCALSQQLILATFACLALGIVAALLWLVGLQGRVNTVLFAVAAFAPLMLLREFARRFAFAHLRMGTALAIDCVVSGLQVAGIVLLFVAGHLNAVTAFLALGLGAGVGSVSGLVAMRRSFSIRLGLLRQAVREHWRFGRWVLAGMALTTLQCYLVHWLLALMSGTAGTGVYAACMTIVLVLNPLLLGFGNVLGPKTAKAYVEGGCRQLRAIVWRVCLGLGAIMVLYCVVVFIAGDWIISALYNGSEYSGQGHLLNVLAFTGLIWALELGAACAIRAMNRPEIGFRVTCVSAAVTLVCSVVFIPQFGMLGGAYAVFAGQLCSMALQNLAFFYLSAPERAADETEVTRTHPEQLISCGESI